LREEGDAHCAQLEALLAPAIVPEAFLKQDVELRTVHELMEEWS